MADISVDLYFEILNLLDQPNQEQVPVAIVEISDYQTAAAMLGDMPLRKAVQELYEGALRIGDKLYTHQPKREPLSDDVIKKMWTMSAIFGTNLEKATALTRAIEKAHGIGE